MLVLETDIEGKRLYYGEAKRTLKEWGFCLGGGWEYHKGFFDGIMNRDQGETIYLRMPFHVVKGQLDQDNALIEFEQPFVIKHVVHLGLERDGSTLLTTVGLGQFQEPLDSDGNIRNKSKWVEFGEEAIGDILNDL